MPIRLLIITDSQENPSEIKDVIQLDRYSQIYV